MVGGGVSGLATALSMRDRARQQGGPEPRLTVLEAEPHVGGKIRTLRTDEGYTCEWGVNGFLNKEPLTLELCQRLELQQQLLPAATAFKNRFLFARGRLRPVPMHPLKFLFSGILPLGAKLRLIRELWVAPRPPDEGDESVAEFARRRVGPVAYETLVDAMQTGIYAGDPERMSVVSSFPRVVEVEQQHGSLIRGMARLARQRRAEGEPMPGAGPRGHLTSFRRGMQTLVDRLADELGRDTVIRCGAPVRALERVDGRWSVQIEHAAAEDLRCDAAVLACPAHAATPIVDGLDPPLGQLLRRIPYSPLVVASLGFSREAVAHPLDGFGFLAPRSAGLRVLGALWTSTLFPGRAPGGSVLLRVMIGGARDPGALDLDDDELERTVVQELSGPLGIGAPPSFRRIFRHRRAIPQYELGHAALLDQIEARRAPIPGLFLTGNAYRGIGVNDCVHHAGPVADQVLQWLAAQPDPRAG